MIKPLKVQVLEYSKYKGVNTILQVQYSCIQFSPLTNRINCNVEICKSNEAFKPFWLEISIKFLQLSLNRRNIYQKFLFLQRRFSTKTVQSSKLIKSSWLWTAKNIPSSSIWKFLLPCNSFTTVNKKYKLKATTSTW